MPVRVRVLVEPSAPRPPLELKLTLPNSWPCDESGIAKLLSKVADKYNAKAPAVPGFEPLTVETYCVASSAGRVISTMLNVSDGEVVRFIREPSLPPAPPATAAQLAAAATAVEDRLALVGQSEPMMPLNGVAMPRSEWKKHIANTAGRAPSKIKAEPAKAWDGSMQNLCGSFGATIPTAGTHRLAVESQANDLRALAVVEAATTALALPMERLVFKSRLCISGAVVPDPRGKFLTLNKCVTEYEQQELAALANRRKKAGRFAPLVAGRDDVWIDRVDKNDTFVKEPLLEEMTVRLESMIGFPCRFPIDPVAGRYILWAGDGAPLPLEAGAYSAAEHGVDPAAEHLRCVIIVQMGKDGGKPTVAGTQLSARSGDGYAYFASRSAHQLPAAKCNPLICFSFGWAVPNAFEFVKVLSAVDVRNRDFLATIPPDLRGDDTAKFLAAHPDVLYESY